jgi:hypothetical protein
MVCYSFYRKIYVPYFLSINVIFSEKYQKLKEKLKSKREKIKELEQQLDSRNEQQELAEGTGVFVNKILLNEISVCSKTASIMARALFKAHFGREYLATHSLFKTYKNPLPVMDEDKRKVIFGKKYFHSIITIVMN